MRQRQYHRNGHVAVDSAAIERAIQVAPGMVRLRVFDPRSKDPAVSQVEDEASGPVDVDGFAEFLQCDDEDCGGVLGADRIVTEFSAASRRNLGRAIASVDWPSVIRPGHRLAAVTLTLPRDWRKTTPQPDVSYRHLRKFDKRHKRATGRSMSCGWKREFQRRKAPHYHLPMPLPLTIGNMAVQDWIPKAWYESVGSGDERHLRAGTRVDWSEGMRMSDANRAAAYFCGYSSGKADESEVLAPIEAAQQSRRPAYARAILLAATTGIRRGELYAVRQYRKRRLAQRRVASCSQYCRV